MFILSPTLPLQDQPLLRPSQVIDGRLVGFDLTSAHVGNSGPAILRLEIFQLFTSETKKHV